MTTHEPSALLEERVRLGGGGAFPGFSWVRVRGRRFGDTPFVATTAKPSPSSAPHADPPALSSERAWIAAVLIGGAAVLALLAGCSPRASTPPSIVVPSAEPSSSMPSATALPAARSCEPPPPITAPPTPPPDRARLAEGLDAFLGDMVRSDRSEIVARPAPFLARGTIWDGLHYGHSHPFYFHLGSIEGTPTVALSSSSALVGFARQAGLMLDDDAKRVVYLKTFLSLDPKILQLLESPQDIHFTAPRDIASLTLSAEDMEMLRPIILDEIQRRRQIEDRHSASIKPMCLKGAFPFRGVIHAIKRQQTLVRLEVTLERSGEVAVREVVLAERVPVPAVYP
jgi:hypothetical protein